MFREPRDPFAASSTKAKILLGLCFILIGGLVGMAISVLCCCRLTPIEENFEETETFSATQNNYGALATSQSLV